MRISHSDLIRLSEETMSVVCYEAIVSLAEDEYEIEIHNGGSTVIVRHNEMLIGVMDIPDQARITICAM